MTRKTNKALAVVMSLSMVLAGVANSPVSDAAAKVKLSAKKATLASGASKTVSIKGVKKSNVKKLTLKTSKKSVATAKKISNIKFKVTGSKKLTTKSKATITAKISLKKAVNKKKSYTLKYTATVKAAKKASVTVNSLSGLEAGLKKLASTGGIVTLSTTEEGLVEIANADYSKVDLVVNAPNADIVNSATYNTVKINAIKSSTWTEKGKNNDITVASTNATRIVVDAAASVDSITFEGTGAGVVEVAGSVSGIFVESIAPVNIKANGTAAVTNIDVTAASTVTVEATEKAAIGEVEVSVAGAKVGVSASTEATVSKVVVEANSEVTVGGSSNQATQVQKTADAVNVTVTAPNATVETIVAPTATPSASPSASASASPSASPSASAATSASPTSSTEPTGSSDTPAGGSFTSVTKNVEITFDANGGTIAAADQKKIVDVDTSVSVPSATNGDKILVGWATTATAAKADLCGPGGTFNAEASMTKVYAIWASSVKVAFVGGAGSTGTVADVTISESNKSSTIATIVGSAITKTDYEIEKWSLVSDTTSASSDALVAGTVTLDTLKTSKIGYASVSSDVATITLYAVWKSTTAATTKTEIAATKVELDGASSIASATLSSGTKDVSLSAVTWKTSSNENNITKNDSNGYSIAFETSSSGATISNTTLTVTEKGEVTVFATITLNGTAADEYKFTGTDTTDTTVKKSFNIEVSAQEIAVANVSLSNDTKSQDLSSASAENPVGITLPTVTISDLTQGDDKDYTVSYTSPKNDTISGDIISCTAAQNVSVIVKLTNAGFKKYTFPATGEGVSDNGQTITKTFAITNSNG